MTAQLRIAPGAPVLAFDVGGTDIKATVVAADGAVAATVRTPTPAVSDHIVDDVLDVLAGIAARLGGSPAAAGLALPGIVDDDAGIAICSENLRWRDVPFRDRAAARLGLPVALVHDVRASTLAELALGSAAGCRDALVVTVGTGIAAGVIVDGRVVVRAGYAGEIGHAVVRPGGRACMCGNHGCLEATASAAAIARRYTEDTGHAVPGARDVLDRVDTDPVAREIWDDAVDALAFGLSHACAALAPEAIVVAGGLSEAGDALLGPLQRRLDAYFPIRSTALRRARLGGDAGVIGAALRARTLTDAA
ncbi:ROK family protein [Microbacterium luticocti]|uniref:ROK family protein n=1 Tax=Microbacterium luticocti TaxID=451764 RepID=UPI000415E76D|nr:ROK family protein [Microbacterium luticocti]